MCVFHNWPTVGNRIKLRQFPLNNIGSFSSPTLNWLCSLVLVGPVVLVDLYLAIYTIAVRIV